jgi:hypothetical protein
MKTKFFTLAALLMLTATLTMASAPKRKLIFVDSLGRKLEMPVKTEEAVDCLPFNAAYEFQRSRLGDVYKTFDLSEMYKPETDADDIPEALKDLIHTVPSNR